MASTPDVPATVPTYEDAVKLLMQYNTELSRIVTVLDDKVRQMKEDHNIQIMLLNSEIVTLNDKVKLMESNDKIEKQILNKRTELLELDKLKFVDLINKKIINEDEDDTTDSNAPCRIM